MIVAHGQRWRQRGLSLIEMMVGITVGMIVVAGASLMMTNQVAEHSRLMLETQVQQDLRAAGDLMLRDLRRAGFWATPDRGVWAPGMAAPASSPYAATSPAVDTQNGSQVTYSYSRADDYVLPIPSTPEDDLIAVDEAFGFRLSNDVLQSLMSGTWQPLTDPNTLTITGFSVNLRVQPVTLAGYCTNACPVGAANCPPEQHIRRIDIVLTGHAKHDAKVVRTINVSSRLRNDLIVGACP